MLKKTCYLATLMLVAFFSIAAISDADPLAALISRITALSESQRQEKVYLHLDKPYYTAGDNIWFKAYVLDEHNLNRSSKSSVLYVDLIARGGVVRSLKLPLENGVGWGDINLTDTLPEGNYRVRAYTQWMRNAGEEFFFDKQIAVGNGLANKVSVSSKFDFPVKSDTSKIQATLVYRDREGKVLVNKAVETVLTANGKNKFSSKAVTDSKGEIRLSLPGSKTSTDKLELITIITVDDNTDELEVVAVPENPNIFDVRFFPEGGTLVKGIPVKVAVKAVNAAGLGEAVTGTIQNGESSVQFSTNANGLGYFTLTPGTTAPQKAEIKFRNGLVRAFGLPEVQASGYGIMVRNVTAWSKIVRVSVSERMLNKANLSLIGQRNGNVYFTRKLVADKPFVDIAIPTGNFPAGVLQLTLLSEKNIPVAERFAFIDHKKDHLFIDVDGIKETYTPRSAVEFSLDAPPGSYSISVTHTPAVKPDPETEGNLLTAFLLTSDLKSYVERPNQYFNRNDADADLLMLTATPRQISWETIYDSNIPQPKYPAESLMTISGKITENGKPVANGKMTLVKGVGGFELATVTTDNQGRFRFDSLSFADSTKLLVQARTAKNKRDVKIHIDNIPGQSVLVDKTYPDRLANINEQLNTYINQSDKFFKEQMGKGQFSSAIQIEQVSITSGRNLKAEATNGFIRMTHSADQVFTSEQLDTVPFLTSFFADKIRGDYRKYTILIDGQPLSQLGERSGFSYYNSDDSSLYLQYIEPSTIAKIEVMSSINYKAVFRRNARGYGVMLITTKRGGNFRDVVYAPGITTITPRGFNNFRNFLSPDHSEHKDARPDLRSTVYWNPQIAANDNDVLKVKYFNPDMPGEYRIVIEGVGETKGLARKEIRYNVSSNL